MTVLPSVHIRPPVADDAPSIAALLGELGYPATAEQIRARFTPFADAVAASIVVAVLEGEVVGIVTVHSLFSIHANEPVALLSTLVVAATHQGRGVGKALVAYAEAWARDNGAVRISVSSGLHREGAHEFYERQGYSRTGVRLTKALVEPRPGQAGG